MPIPSDATIASFHEIKPGSITICRLTRKVPVVGCDNCGARSYIILSNGHLSCGSKECDTVLTHSH